jgi:glycosyltransferase involved in cell wall biosynthesis
VVQRRWLPRRPVLFAPVFSNVSPGSVAVDRRESRPAIGVFGFRADGCRALPVVAAVSELRRRGLDPDLLLVGAPGDGTRQALEWRDAAGQAGCADALRFTGVLGEPALARALSSLDIAVVPVSRGPEPRQGTLAACLALGLPVVAFDGPHRWDRLTDEQAVVLIPPRAESLAHALMDLLEDSDARAEQGVRARDFYRRHMAPEVVAGDMLRFLATLTLDQRRLGSRIKVLRRRQAA